MAYQKWTDADRKTLRAMRRKILLTAAQSEDAAQESLAIKSFDEIARKPAEHPCSSPTQASIAAVA